MGQQALIELRDLHRQLDGKGIINGITAQVQPGNVIALLGKNGSGKTTLLQTILGFGVPAYGEALLMGEKAIAIGGDIKQRLGFVSQQDELIASMTGEAHLQMFRAFRPRWNDELVARWVRDWLIPVETRVAKMSVGQRQKLSIVLAMAHEPELLVLDEPVASLDPVARRQFLQQLIDVAADSRRAVVFSTHIVSDVERVANQIWMLREGRLAFEGDLDQLKESVVRLTLRSRQTLPAHLPLAHCVRQKIQGNHAQVVLTDWCEGQKADIETTWQANVEVEYMGLEDIFLELNT